MDLALSALQCIFYTIMSHPFYSILGSVLVLAVLVKFYCRLTMGICDVQQDMTGKTVLITGATAGIGKATALDLASRNARVLLACRNIEKANKVANEIISMTGNRNVFVKCLDLSSFKSVRKCAQSVLETEQELHILISNAGILTGCGQITEDGCELIMQSNYLGHFLFTLLLLDLLTHSAPSRIINVCSAAHAWAKFDIEDLKNGRKLHAFNVYSNSKLAIILFTKELAERVRGTGVTVNALCPGCVNTDIMDPAFSFCNINLKDTIKSLGYYVIGKTAMEGAQTTIRLAVDPSLEKTTGKYFVDCKEAPVSELAKDKTLSKRLFHLSEQIVGESL